MLKGLAITQLSVDPDTLSFSCKSSSTAFKVTETWPYNPNLVHTQHQAEKFNAFLVHNNVPVTLVARLAVLAADAARDDAKVRIVLATVSTVRSSIRFLTG